MSRYTKQIDDHIIVAYGYDNPLQGYFLQVYDTRLEWSESKTDEENAEAEKTDPSGEGEINSFATNDMLLSKHVVNRMKMVSIMETYNVDKKHIQATILDIPF